MEAMHWDSSPKLRQPGPGLLVQGLERRRRVGDDGAVVRGLHAGAPSGSGRSTRRSSSTSRSTRPTVRLTEGRHPRDRVAGARLIERAPARGRDRDVVFLIGRGAEPALEDLLGDGRRRRARARRGAWWCRSARCSPTSRTRGRCRSPGSPPTPRAGPSGWGSRRRATRGRPGIVGVLHDACARAGLLSASLWAPVPHYVATVPSPKATLALLGGSRTCSRCPIDTDGPGGGGRGVRAPARRGGRERARGARAGRAARAAGRRRGHLLPQPSLRATRSRSEFERFLKEQGDEK